MRRLRLKLLVEFQVFPSERLRIRPIRMRRRLHSAAIGSRGPRGLLDASSSRFAPRSSRTDRQTDFTPTPRAGTSPAGPACPEGWRNWNARTGPGPLPAADGQVHPTARSVSSHPVRPVQLSSGLQLLSTVPEPKTGHDPTPRFALENARRASGPGLSCAVCQSKNECHPERSAATELSSDAQTHPPRNRRTCGCFCSIVKTVPSTQPTFGTSRPCLPAALGQPRPLRNS